MTGRIHNHIIPQYYLRGFCSSEGKIFRYERGKTDVLPTSVKSVAQEIGFYSDKLEKELADSIEAPANALLDQLRQGKMIAPEKKIILAEYMINIMKRTHKGWARTQKRAPEIVDDTFKRAEEFIKKQVGIHPHRRYEIEKQWEDANRGKEDLKRNFPRDAWYSALRAKTTPKSVEALSKLSWSFYVSDQPIFLTSDNPVFYPEDIGIGRAQSVVSFPIASNIALEANNLIEPMGFYAASREIVDRINQRTIQGAVRYIFHCEEADWVSKLINGKN